MSVFKAQPERKKNEWRTEIRGLTYCDGGL